MTTQLSPTPVFKAFDNNGAPLAFGLLYSYGAGTTTPQATYTDFTGATANTNPVTLNARGECGLWLDPTLSYKLILKDSSGNQIWSVDNIQGLLATAQQIGEVLWPITTAETAAGVTIQDYAIPNDTGLARSRRYSSANTWDYRYDQRLFELYLSKYGAVFNGTTDDTAAIADAINAIYAAGTRRRVIMPSGNLTAAIKTAGVLNFYCGAVGIDFNGLVLDASSLTSGTVITLNGNGGSPYSRYSDSLPYENFTVLGNTTAGTTTTLMSVAGGGTYAGEVSGAVLRQFVLNGGGTGMSLGANVYIFFAENFRIMNQLAVGLDVPAGVNAGENVCFRAGQISNVISGSSTGIGIRLQAAANDYGVRLQNVSVDYNDQAFEILGGELFFDQCYLEMNNTANPIGSIALTSPALVAGMQFFGGEIALSETTTARVNIFTIAGGVNTRIKFIGTRFAGNLSTLPTAQLVNITDGGASTVIIEGCTSDGIYKGNALKGILNRVYNGDFELGNLNGWTTSGTSYTWTADSTNPHSGTWAMKVVSATANNGTAVSNPITVRPGQQVLTDGWVDLTAFTQGSVQLFVQYASDAAFADIIASDNAGGPYTATTSGYTESNYVGAAPQGANYARINVTCASSFEGTAYFDDIRLAAI